MKVFSVKVFGENVGSLLSGWAILQWSHPVMHKSPDVVHMDLNMLFPLPLNWISRYFYITFIVHPNVGRRINCDTKFPNSPKIGLETLLTLLVKQIYSKRGMGANLSLMRAHMWRFTNMEHSCMCESTKITGYIVGFTSLSPNHIILVHKWK